MTETTEITLIRRQYDHEKKCGMCGFRTPVQWNLGEDENEELAACGSCTTEYIADNEEYTITRAEA
jgi:transcription elongation factor Elf1